MQRVKMKIGTRLTLLLLLALTPEVAVYTYWTVERSAAQYLNDLKQESPRAITLGLVPAVENDLRAREWDQIGDVFRRIRPDGVAAALLGLDGGLRFRGRRRLGQRAWVSQGKAARLIGPLLLLRSIKHAYAVDVRLQHLGVDTERRSRQYNEIGILSLG